MKISTFFFVLLFCAVSVFSQYTSVDAFPNLSFISPTEIISPPDSTNRMFVMEKSGRVLVFPNNSGVTQAKTFLVINDDVTQTTYQGAFSIAFHPDFINNRFFYVYYTKNPLATLEYKVVRYTVSPSNPDSALPGSAYTIITQSAPSSNHTGGRITFGSDGYLYIGWGDGSPGSGGDPNNNAQNKSSLLGKILRIDVNSTSGGNNYSIPPSNPFFGNPNGWREEIYAYGLRNPWKFSFDTPTGRLWAGDVGQVQREEIDIITIGGNYGWRRKEGTLCFNPSSNCDTAGLTAPLYEYPHSSGVSITGGCVYRGSQMPGLAGKYIYSDWSNGNIWALTWDGVNPPTNAVLFDSPHSIVSFGTDAAKNIYYIHYNSTAGKIYKIIDPSFNGITTIGNEIPAEFSLKQNYPNPFNPETKIRFDVAVSSHVKLTVYDVTGKIAASLVDNDLPPAGYEISFDGSGLSSGMYFYKLETAGFTEVKKMILIK